MATFYLPERKETPKRYDNNRDVNNLIAKVFKESIIDFDENNYWEDIPIVIKCNILLANDYKDVPYGGKTLGEAGCAVFCFEQGLCYRKIFKVLFKKIMFCFKQGLCYRGGRHIKLLSKYIADLGYYEFGKGTWHNLFDHFELRRATHFQEIFDALKMGKLITILAENKEYSPIKAVEGSHFVNIVGKLGEYFVIDDPQMGRINVPMREIFNATRVAWIW